MRKIDTVIVHHSAGAAHATVAELRDLHVRQRGYSDIGYHFVVRRQGAGGAWVIEPGRPVELVGAHDAGENTGSIGVCICGDYTRGPVDAWGWRLLVDFVAQLCARYQLIADQVEGHREHEPRSTPTACPGFDPSELRAAVRRALTAAA